jgi:hypothetical protein
VQNGSTPRPPYLAGQSLRLVNGAGCNFQRYLLIGRPLRMPAELGEALQDLRRWRARISRAQEIARIAPAERDGFIPAQKHSFGDRQEIKGYRSGEMPLFTTVGGLQPPDSRS